MAKSKVEIAIEALVARLEALEAKLVPVKKAEAPAPVEVPRYPIPAEYRELVDTILNKSFGITIEPQSDSPAFQFTIVVPEKYSSMTPAYKEMYKFDLRPRVITYAEGKLGVKDWCDKVYNNFSNEIKALIVSDRNG